MGLVKQVRKNEEALSGYRDAMTCHLGNFGEYAGIRRQINELEKGAVRRGNAQARIDAANSINTLRPGDVIVTHTNRRASYAVVIDDGKRNGMDARPSVMGVDRQVRRISASEFEGPVQVVANVRLPRDVDIRKPHQRRIVSGLLADATAELGAATRMRPKRDVADVDHLRRQLRAHPCHGCADREDHARWGERYFRLEHETRQLRERIEHRTNSIARAYDKVCAVLAELGYLTDAGESAAVTESGRQLARLHTELDLLVAEILRRDLLEALTPPEFAAVVSMLVHEGRREAEQPRIPSGRCEDVIEEIVDLWLDITSVENAIGASQLREPDASFVWSTYRWASGARLSSVLRDADLSAGDFIRWTRRVIDLLEQIAAASPGYATVARNAGDLLKRGIVAAVDVDE